MQNGFCCKSFLLLDIVKINGVMLSSGVCNGSEIVWMGLKILFEWGVVLVRSRKGFTIAIATWILRRKSIMEIEKLPLFVSLIKENYDLAVMPATHHICNQSSHLVDRWVSSQNPKKVIETFTKNLLIQ